MEMLENDGISDIVSWLPDGDAFAIHDKKRFAAEVLPLFFKGSIKFSSFTRRLKRWKFLFGPTASKSKSSTMYYHPLFKRNEVDKCIGMKPEHQVNKNKKVSENTSFEITTGATQQYSRQNIPELMKSSVVHDEQALHSQPVLQNPDCTQALTLDHQEIQHHDMQSHYMSYVREIYAAHQAHLAKQMEVSRFAMMSLVMNYGDTSL